MYQPCSYPLCPYCYDLPESPDLRENAQNVPTGPSPARPMVELCTGKVQEFEPVNYRGTQLNNASQAQGTRLAPRESRDPKTSNNPDPPPGPPYEHYGPGPSSGMGLGM
jgi:hypothetical protein